MRPCIPPPPPARDTAPCAPPESGEWVISPRRSAAILHEWRTAEHDTDLTPPPEAP
jgi:hypothetical protein